MRSREGSEYAMPRVPIEIASETPIALKRSGTSLKGGVISSSGKKIAS
jgi:hypothetical protein